MSHQAKKQLRKDILTRRDAMTLPEVRKASVAISSHLSAHLPLEKGDVVAAYWPIRNEPDIRLWMEMVIEEGFELVLPVIEQEDAPLLFHPYDPALGVKSARMGTYEPVVRSRKSSSVWPNIILVPLLAFDEQGFRLGYGGGYYDRTLQRLEQEETVHKRLLTVGVGYGFQQVKTLPRELHDRRLDCIITEETVMVPTS